MDILLKVSFFDKNCTLKWFGPGTSAPWNSLKKQLSGNFRYFHGSESLSTDFIFKTSLVSQTD